MNICKTCKWHLKKWFETCHKCSCPKLGPSKIDAVTGKSLDDMENSCYHQRSAIRWEVSSEEKREQLCGPEGRFWEKK